MKKNLFYLPNLHLLFVCIGGMFLSLTAQQNLTDDNLAVSGYDVVSYQQNEVAEGSPQFKVLHNKAVYLFKNEANQKAFKSHPEKYLPQYGGWCAYAMGRNGDKVSINLALLFLLKTIGTSVHRKLYSYPKRFSFDQQPRRTSSSSYRSSQNI